MNSLESAGGVCSAARSNIRAAEIREAMPCECAIQQRAEPRVCMADIKALCNLQMFSTQRLRKVMDKIL